MRLISLLAGSALASTLLLGPAAAGLLDSPPPDLGAGTTSLVVYRMGPIHYEPGGWVDTTVTCTNLAGATTRMAFEVFDEQDHVVGQVPKVDVAGNASVTFATSADANVPGAVVVASLPPIDHGKGRVSAETKQLSCTAVNRMRADDGSIKEAAVELVKKVAY